MRGHKRQAGGKLAVRYASRGGLRACRCARDAGPERQRREIERWLARGRDRAHGAHARAGET